MLAKVHEGTQDVIHFDFSHAFHCVVHFKLYQTAQFGFDRLLLPWICVFLSNRTQSTHVRPILEYASNVWNPHLSKHINAPNLTKWLARNDSKLNRAVYSWWQVFDKNFLLYVNASGSKCMRVRPNLLMMLSRPKLLIISIEYTGLLTITHMSDWVT